MPIEQAVKFEIPAALQAEHAELHDTLVEATRQPGAVGEAARALERLLHPHFVKEEQFALPPLGLLAQIAQRGVSAEMAEVLPLTRRLKAELPAMLAEHKQIAGALDKLRAAARAAQLPQYERFAEALALHAQTEERVLYPAVVLLGEFVARSLGQTESASRD